MEYEALKIWRSLKSTFPFSTLPFPFSILCPNPVSTFSFPYAFWSFGDLKLQPLCLPSHLSFENLHWPSWLWKGNVIRWMLFLNHRTPQTGKTGFHISLGICKSVFCLFVLFFSNGSMTGRSLILPGLSFWTFLFSMYIHSLIISSSFRVFNITSTRMTPKFIYVLLTSPLNSTLTDLAAYLVSPLLCLIGNSHLACPVMSSWHSSPNPFPRVFSTWVNGQSILPGDQTKSILTSLFLSHTPSHLSADAVRSFHRIDLKLNYLSPSPLLSFVRGLWELARIITIAC